MYREASNLTSLILDTFDQLVGTTIGDVVLELLTSSDGHEHPAVESIFSHLKEVLDALVRHMKGHNKLLPDGVPSRGIQKERVLPAPVGTQPTMSFPSYMVRAVLT